MEGMKYYILYSAASSEEINCCTEFPSEIAAYQQGLEKQDDQLITRRLHSKKGSPGETTPVIE